jgi:hypothetical protein
VKTNRHLLALLFAVLFLPALSFGQTVITYTTTGVLQVVTGADKLGLGGSTITVTNTLTEGETPNSGTNNQYASTATIADASFPLGITLKNVAVTVTIGYVGANNSANNIGLTGTDLGFTVTASVFVPSVSSLEPEPISSTNLTSADTVIVSDGSASTTYSFSSGAISSVPAITCVYSVSPLTLDFPVGGSEENVSVNVGAGCAWTAVSNNPWITVSPASGTGTGTVMVTTGNNTTGAPEIGSALIAGSAVNITQNGPVVCTFSVSPLSLAFPSTGGAPQPLTISASASNCSWTASSSLSWLSLNATSGMGSATVLASALPNSNAQNLQGNITVAGQSIPVSEAGTSACSFTVAPSSLLFIANGGSQNLTLSASGVSCAWTASILQTGLWASVSPTSGSGSGTVTVTVAGNGSGGVKNATLNIAGQVVTIQQSNTNSCFFSATTNPSPLNFVSSPSTGTVSVTASGSACQWNVSSIPDWLVPNAYQGTGTLTLSLQATANSGTSTRSGTMTIAGISFTVTQNGTSTTNPCNFAVSPTSLAFTNNGGSLPVSLTASQSTCAWTATSNVTWATVNPSSGTGTPPLPLTVVAQGNTTGTNLTAVLTIAGLTVNVTQSATACTYTVSPTTLSFPSQGGTLPVTVTASSSSCAWTAASTMTGVSFVPTGSFGSATIAAIAVTNTGSSAESGNVTIAGQVIPVTIAGSGTCTFAVSNASILFPNSGGSAIASVITNGLSCAWTASAPPWITLSATGGTGSTSILITAAQDQTGPSQSGTVMLAGTSIPVSQTGGCTFTISPSSISADVRGILQPIAINASSPSCVWTASAPTFSTLTATNGTGSGATTLSIPYNTTGTDLTGTVTIAGQPITVFQAFTEQVFQDVPPGSFGFDAINLLSQKNITNGCAPTLYCPTANITRAQMAYFLVTAAYNNGPFTASQTPYFADVPLGSFEFNQIQKLYELGITNGCGGGKFCPTQTVTRDQMAVFLIKARYGATTVFDFPPAQIFNDVPPTYWAYSWIQRMSEDQITSGCAPSLYCPTENVTRAQMAIFLMKAIYNDFAAPGTPAISSVVPNILVAGTATNVAITGINTAFSQGLTLVSAIPGVTISNVSVSGPTTLTATMTVQTNAPAQPDAVYVITGTQEEVVPFGITVP